MRAESLCFPEEARPGSDWRIRGGKESEREGYLPTRTNFESGIVRSFSMAFA
jgi:hypothetical protein